MTRVPLDMLSDDEIERLYNAGLVSDDEIERIVHARISPRDLAILDGIAYGIAKLLHTPLNQLAAEAASLGLDSHNKDTRGFARGNLHEENKHMSANPYVGAAVQSYPTVAAHAVRSIQQQSPSPVYGYLRTGTQQKIYLYPTFDEARGWFATLAQPQAQPHDYAAVFVATDLSRPALENFGHSTAFSGEPQVGNLLPFLLGIPAGAVGGYFLRRWQEQHPGHTLPFVPPGKLPAPIIPPLPPKTSGDWVGGPTHPVNFMDRPDWSQHRAYAQSLANSILENDQIFDQVARQILQLVGGDAHLLSQPNWPQTRMRIRGGIRRVIDTDQLIDQMARPIIRYLMESRPAAVQGDYVGGPWLDIAPMVGGPWLDIEPSVGGPWLDIEPMIGHAPSTDVTSEDLDTIAQELSQTFGVPLERTRAEIMEIAHDMNLSVGGPWLDIEPAYTIGGPWLDVVGAYDDPARRRAWPQTKALIQSAINEVSASANQAPAEAYVWSLDPPETATYTPTRVVPFSSPAQALDYMRERIQTPHVALALFDRRSPHWPNPTNWTKSNAPEHEHIIAQQIARFASPRMAGDYAASRRQTSIGSALDDVRTRAQSIANKRAGSVVGVIHTTKDGLWHALAFRNADDADDWLGTATQDPAAFTYAAYYDKEDFSWPHPVNEKIGGGRVTSQPDQPIRRAPATTAGAR